MNRLGEWFKALTTGGKIAVAGGAILTSLLGVTMMVGAASVPQSPPRPAPQEIKTVSETSPIDFQTVTEDDASIPKGETRIAQTGVKGVRTTTYEVTLVGNKETGRKKVNETVTAQPVNQVVKNGTYVAPPPPASVDCPNGTYTNSAGNIVCRPYEAPSAPAGATARCVDGTYSYSQSRRGTCSHHGGVAVWL